MAKLVLCGLESKPKLNGREVTLVKYHASRSRWEVDLDGKMPMIDLFKIEWDNDWYEPIDEDKYPSLSKQKGPSFKEVLDKKIEKQKLSDMLADLTVLSGNGKKVNVFDAEGKLLEDLAGKSLPRKAEGNDVDQRCFPLLFQKKAPEDRTLAVRPVCLRVREEDEVEKLRKRKVEMSVSQTHDKPQLDEQFGELGPFQSLQQKWMVRPDLPGLWDVQVDGSPKPVLLRSAELCEEASGARLVDPVRLAGPSGNNVFAAVEFQRGQIIFEDEPALLAFGHMSLSKLWLQYKQLSPEKQDIMHDLPKGLDKLERLCPGKQLKREDLSEQTNLSAGELEQAWNFFRIFDRNCSTHRHMDDGYLLYLHLGRLKHSCRPNAMTDDAKLESDDTRTNKQMLPVRDPFKKALVAKSDIAEGEEITISYLGEEELMQPRELRQQKLLNSFGFVCACKRCSEDSDDLLRGISPGSLSGAGAEAKSLAEIKEMEEKLVSKFAELLQEVSTSAKGSDSMLALADEAVKSGLPEKHWLVVKVRSYFLGTEAGLEMAADNLTRLLELQEEALGQRSWLTTESLGDVAVKLDRFTEAFRCYADTLQALKLASSSRHPGNSEHCERVRQKLRMVLEGRNSEKKTK